MKAFGIKVSGVVQGVGFRYHTMQEARSLGLCGTVENKSDGSVRIHVEGTEKSVLVFLEWCHKGPSASKVTQLDYIIKEPMALTSFEILR